MTDIDQELTQRLEEFDDHKIINIISREAPLLIKSIHKNDYLKILLRELMIAKEQDRIGFTGSVSEWREFMWGERIEEAFLAQKRNLDCFSYWQLICKNKNNAMDYYYKLCNKEISFDSLQANGIKVNFIQHRRLSEMSESLKKILSRSKIGIPLKPFQSNKLFCIYQLANRKQAVLNDLMRAELLEKLEIQWCHREINRYLDG
ncbi:hypothetical protein OAE68_00500 [Synechococcus sp. AH-551-A10]|nr:hypothetical protein [Synechococcus sp. AH-551-A10]MDB4682140.1 hypothetical protein [Synechococcus sp. AH-551-A10]